MEGGDAGITRQVDVAPTCGQRPCGSRGAATLPGVRHADGDIEFPAAEVYALAGRLRAQAHLASEAGDRLAAPPAVGGPLQAALADFLLCHRTAAHALTGELASLGATIAAVADSWLHLDGALLAPRGRATPR